MGYLKYSRNQSSKTNGLIPVPKLNPNEKHNIRIYDMLLSNEDSHSVVCLTTVNTEVVCYETSENNLNLDQIQYITLKTRENGIPYGFVIPDVSAYFNYSYDNENTPPSKLTPHQNSFLYDYGDGSYGNLPPHPNPEKKPQPKNDDESKDYTGSWNNLWALLFFALIIIISLYVNITFQDRKKTIQPSTFINSTL